MAYEETPLGFRKPDGADPVRQGDNHIAHNAQTAEELIADINTRFPSGFDGGSPETIYPDEQINVDGGTV